MLFSIHYTNVKVFFLTLLILFTMIRLIVNYMKFKLNILKLNRFLSPISHPHTIMNSGKTFPTTNGVSPISTGRFPTPAPTITSCARVAILT